MNVDLGGGTCKIAVCEAGEIVEMTAVDVGARILAFDAEGRVERIEAAGRRFADETGFFLAVGDTPDAAGLARMVERMAERLFAIISESSLGAETAALLRLDPLENKRKPDAVTFSGGVAEYIYGRQQQSFGDLGAALAASLLERVKAWGPRIETSDQGIRATVVGASQYTIQVSGATIFVTPHGVLPLRYVPVITPDLELDGDRLDREGIAAAVRVALRRFDLSDGEKAVAVCYRWKGSATFARLDDFCRSITAGLATILARGLPLILVCDGDVGGLLGIHCHAELRLPNPVVSIDGIDLKEFDFIDIGALLASSGAVPVVIKSLVFPASPLRERDC